MKTCAAAAIACVPFCLLILASLSVAQPVAADVLWLGRTSATLAWDPPTDGIVEGYLVMVTRNGGAEIGEQLVTAPRATLTANLGDRVSVRIRSLGRATPDGPTLISAPSPPSPVVQFLPLAPPSNPSSGLLVEHCGPCQKLRLRPIADLAQSFDRFAPPAPWKLVGRGSAQFPHYEQLWQHGDSGALLLLTIDPSTSLVGATSVDGMASQRALQIAELDGDPEPEIITFFEGGPSLVFWERREMDIVPIGYLVVPSGWNLVGAEDVDGDGKAELWLQWGTPGTVDVLSWTPGGVDWRGRLDTGIAGDVAAVADFDGDGTPDLLWRDAAGNLTTSYVTINDGHVALLRNLHLPHQPGDEKLEVKGAADLVATPGLEIVVQNTETFAVGAIAALGSSVDVRIPLFVADPSFEVVRTN